MNDVELFLDYQLSQAEIKEIKKDYPDYFKTKPVLTSAYYG